ncbi:MAG: class I SAM-dependent DNA methyltransferase [Acetobacter sp.]|nr:class I SAM-dependent DNA methyltransferase [Acetobacter sp.]
MNQREEAKAAKEFAEKWKGRGDEKQDTSNFWTELLEEVFGVEKVAKSDYLHFEKEVKSKNKTTNKKTKKYIDVWIPATKTLIEQKSLGVDLTKTYGDEKLTPFYQAKRYADDLPLSEKPRWIVTCNFAEFRVYDLNQELPEDKPQVIELAKLPKEYHRLKFLVDEKHDRIEREEQISRDAGDIVQRIYDEILPAYKTQDEAELHSLNKLCVRLVFLFYAEDAGLFDKKNQFCNYMRNVPPPIFHRVLLDLFCILNTPEDKRPYEKEFPYVNGGLFSEEIVVPQISEKAVKVIIEDGGAFDWSQISPTIFGAIFESTLNPGTRRERGMHYTSPENIHKVIDPLFLDGYRKKFDEAMKEKNSKWRKKKLFALQDDLARAKFFDPAAGSGNFLTESYISIRHLENDIVRELYNIKENGGFLPFEEKEFNPIKVSINQFYGIEIHDFAVSVAKTAIWIAESQCIKETEDIIRHEINFLPLKTEAHIHEGNALRMEWREILPPSDEVYIMGNPPFVGADKQTTSQREDKENIFRDEKGKAYHSIGKKIDYVACWFFKAADYMQGTRLRAAFVSTNSITQGEQVALIWKPLFEQFEVRINFAHRTFEWESKSKNKAAVYCVIVGFGQGKQTPCILYTDGQGEEVAQINPYLVDAPTVFIKSRTKPLCDVPLMSKGSQPTDGGNLLFNADELEKFLKQEPKAKHWIKKVIGTEEFINNKERYCLWLVNCPPKELRSMPHVMERVKKICELRLQSTSKNTREDAETSWLFQANRQPETDYLVVPKTSSEKRRYIPIAWESAETIATDAVFTVQNASLYLFGVLTSNVHMAWMRATCGRLEMRYRYSNTIVYNNFPFPTPTDEQRAAIEQTAQAILNARALYSKNSLDDLYDVNTMPKELREAHTENDRAVMKCYGLACNTTEAKIVDFLKKRYKALTEKK